RAQPREGRHPRRGVDDPAHHSPGGQHRLTHLDAPPLVAEPDDELRTGVLGPCYDRPQDGDAEVRGGAGVIEESGDLDAARERRVQRDARLAPRPHQRDHGWHGRVYPRTSEVTARCTRSDGMSPRTVARPTSSRSTKRRFPCTTFLSRCMASRITVTFSPGATSGSPNARIRSACRLSNSSSIIPSSTPRRAAPIMPMETASPCRYSE